MPIPIHALFGENDVQVSTLAHTTMIREGISRNKNSRVQIMADHNHFTCGTERDNSLDC